MKKTTLQLLYYLGMAIPFAAIGPLAIGLLVMAASLAGLPSMGLLVGVSLWLVALWKGFDVATHRAKLICQAETDLAERRNQDRQASADWFKTVMYSEHDNERAS